MEFDFNGSGRNYGFDRLYYLGSKNSLPAIGEKKIELEANLLRDLELRHEQGSLPIRLMYALRKLAENNSELSAILRSFSLL